MRWMRSMQLYSNSSIRITYTILLLLLLLVVVVVVVEVVVVEVVEEYAVLYVTMQLFIVVVCEAG